MAGKVVNFNPEIPDGVYVVRYIGYETGRLWNADKVIVKFGVVEGDFAGLPLNRYYNARSLSDPVGPAGDFEVGDRCHLVKEFRTLLPEVRSISDIDLDQYKDKRILARVESVKRTGTGEPLSASNTYSVIRELIEILPEPDTVL